MANLTVRSLDDNVARQLKIRAAQHGRSMEAEVRSILTAAVTTEPALASGFGTLLVEAFAGVGELGLPDRNELAQPIELP